MRRRREVLQAAIGAAAATGSLSAASLGLGGCSRRSAYEEAASALRRPLGDDAGTSELIRFATLAANGHNTQPWMFRPSDRQIAILPDFARRTPVVDPDDHHLFASLGCAAENLSLAARARGLSGEIGFDDTESGHVVVATGTAKARESVLFAAIPARQCCRTVYDGRTVPGDVSRRLAEAAAGEGVEAIFIDRGPRAEAILDLVVEGNSRQIDDPAFLAELKHWLRFDARSALATRDGLYAPASGNPSLPRWIGPAMFDLFFRKGSENDKYRKQIRSSAGLLVITADTNDRRGWVDAGRAYQRFALRATAEGLRHAFLNQAVEVPEVRGELQACLGLGDRRPDLVLRFGYGPDMPRSLRREVTDVLVG